MAAQAEKSSPLLYTRAKITRAGLPAQVKRTACCYTPRPRRGAGYGARSAPAVRSRSRPAPPYGTGTGDAFAAGRPACPITGHLGAVLRPPALPCPLRTQALGRHRCMSSLGECLERRRPHRVEPAVLHPAFRQPAPCTACRDAWRTPCCRATAGGTPRPG